MHLLKLISSIEAAAYPSHMRGGPFNKWEDLCEYAETRRPFVQVWGNNSYVICSKNEMVDLVIGDAGFTFSIASSLRKYFGRRKFSADLRDGSMRIVRLMEKRGKVRVLSVKQWNWGETMYEVKLQFT